MNFQEYGEIIDKTYERITKNELNKQFLPAEEWIYDNYYVICENMDKCRASYKQLPEKLKKTHVNNLFHHMTEIVKKSNGMIEDKKIIEYFRHLNKTNPLTTKEINCVQEILRFALLGRLAKVCEYIESVRDETEKAENLFGRYLNYIGTDCATIPHNLLYLEKEAPRRHEASLRHCSLRSDSVSLGN